MTQDEVASPAAGSGAALPRSTAITYALPSVGLGFALFMGSIFFLKYATDVLGIAPAAMGWILLASRFWDAVSDPVMGFLSDRTRTRIGRRRPWMLAAALPLGLLIVAQWSPPLWLSSAQMIAWTLVVYLLLYSAWTAFGVPYDALGAELSTDYHERNRIFGFKRVAFGIGSAGALGGVALLTSSDLTQAAGRLTARENALFLSLAGAFVITSLTWYTALRLRERPDYMSRGGHNPLRSLRDVWRNRPARILLTVFIIQQLGVTCVTMMATFFIDYVLHAAEYTAPILVGFMLSATLSVPVWIRAAKRFEKKTLLIVAMVMISLSMMPGLFLGPEDLALVFVITVGSGFASGGCDVLFPSMKADVIDIDELRTGERKEGVYFSVWSFATKSAASAAGILVGFALSAAGYVPNAEQSESAALMIRVLYAGVPLFFWSLAIAIFLRFDLSSSAHAEVRAAIDARGSALPQSPR